MNFCLILISSILTYSNVHAQTFPIDSSSSDTTVINSEHKIYEKINHILRNPEFADDNKLTDNRLRVQAGSLSKYSISSSMTLKGPAIGDPSAPDLPNPDKRVGNYSQKLVGDISGKYRFDSSHTLGFGTGLTFNHPLQGVDKTSVSTPFVSYNIANRIQDVQMLLSPSISYTTTSENLATGQVGAAGLSALFVKDLGTSRFSVSLGSLIGINIYGRGYTAPVSSHHGTSKHAAGIVKPGGSFGGDGNSSQYYIGVSPGIKYKITDHVDFSTRLTIPFYNPMLADNISVIKPNSPTAVFGVGYAYNRDLYIGPSIQIYPTILSPDTTTVNVAMLFSLL
jgi:hypothetical protein